MLENLNQWLRFSRMLPYFMCYDHINYARWVSIYLADASQLPDVVRGEFEAGNFVVKRSAAQFNQVDPDQGQAWLNATGKNDGDSWHHKNTFRAS